jgi:hypothetical protein
LREEIEQCNPDNVFTIFYDQVKEVRESHRRMRDVAASGINNSEGPSTIAAVSSIPVQFSGEEKFGKYVDMAMLHDK